jgi:hypothetical protein
MPSRRHRGNTPSFVRTVAEAARMACIPDYVLLRPCAFGTEAAASWGLTHRDPAALDDPNLPSGSNGPPRAGMFRPSFGRLWRQQSAPAQATTSCSGRC